MLTLGTVFTQHQEKDCITLRCLFKTISVITLVQYSIKHKGNVYHRPQNL